MLMPTTGYPCNICRSGRCICCERGYSINPRAEGGYEESLVIPGDPHWRKAHGELLELHVEKSSTYGTDADPLANFTESAAVLGKPAEYAVLVRILDKTARAVHMIDAGRAHDVREYPDIASLALCAEALLQRRKGFDPATLEMKPQSRWPTNCDPGDETD